MLKIKKNDEVVVIAGRDKGRRGEVLRVLKDGRLMVAGINMVKKHKRPNPNTGDQGGIVPQGSSDSSVQRGDLESRRRKGRPRGPENRRRTESSCLQVKRQRD